MSKKVVSLSIDEEVNSLASRLGINKSAAAQRGIEAELNMPVELKDLLNRKAELENELKIINQRIENIEEKNEVYKKKKTELGELVQNAVDILCDRMATQPPVPHVSWKNQAKQCGLTITELKDLVFENCEKLGIEVIL